MAYTIQAYDDPVVIGGYEFTGSPVFLVEVPILEPANFYDLFEAVRAGDLVVEKNQAGTNGLQVVSHLFNIIETGFDSGIPDGGDLFEEYNTQRTMKAEEEISVTSLTVEPDDFGKEFEFHVDDDYTVILPNLNDVESSKLDRFKNLENEFIKGSFVPLVGQMIEGGETFELYGRGILTISKKTNDLTGISYWFIVEATTIKASKQEGMTKKIEFENVDTFSHTHNFGYKPILQIFVEENGKFVDANADIDSTINSFQINFGLQKTGFVLFV